MNEYSPSGSASGEVDRITILSNAESPSPPIYSKAANTVTGTTGNSNAKRIAANDDRTDIINSWDEGISLVENGHDANDRLQVAFEGTRLIMSFSLTIN